MGIRILPSEKEGGGGKGLNDVPRPLLLWELRVICIHIFTMGTHLIHFPKRGISDNCFGTPTCTSCSSRRCCKTTLGDRAPYPASTLLLYSINGNRVWGEVHASLPLCIRTRRGMWTPAKPLVNTGVDQRQPHPWFGSCTSRQVNTTGYGFNNCCIHIRRRRNSLRIARQGYVANRKRLT